MNRYPIETNAVIKIDIKTSFLIQAALMGNFSSFEFPGILLLCEELDRLSFFLAATESFSLN
jgi:hypothetical protein